MGDMTRDGSVFFGKEYGYSLEGETSRGVRRELTEMEKKLLAIPEDQIKEEMTRIATIANQHGVELPIDDECELLVHPDGTWEVLTLDLSELDTFRNRRFAPSISEQVERMDDYVEWQRESLEKIRKD